MTNPTAVPSAGTVPDAAVAELGAAAEGVISSFAGEIPFGAAAGMLERIAAVHEQVDALMAATGFAHGHHGCEEAPGPKAVINITVPLSTFMDLHTHNREQDQDQGQEEGPDQSQRQEQGPGPGEDQTPEQGQGSGGGEGPARTEDGNIIAASIVRAMAPEAQLRRLVFDDRSGLPLDLGRAQRLAPGYLRTLAFAEHATCAWGGGCDVPVSQCQADHITEFSHGGTTSAANLQPLCSTHNRLKYRRTTRTRTRTRTGNKAGAGTEGPPGR